MEQKLTYVITRLRLKEGFQQTVQHYTLRHYQSNRPWEIISNIEHNQSKDISSGMQGVPIQSFHHGSNTADSYNCNLMLQIWQYAFELLQVCQCYVWQLYDAHACNKIIFQNWSNVHLTKCGQLYIQLTQIHIIAYTQIQLRSYYGVPIATAKQ